LFQRVRRSDQAKHCAALLVFAIAHAVRVTVRAAR
jgi:hypothetical protein